MEQKPTRALGRRLVALTLCAAAAWTSTPSPADASGGSRPSFFNTIEIDSADLRPFRAWLSVLTRADAEADREAAVPCSGGWFSACPYRDWLAFLDGLQGADAWTQLLRVNAYVNRTAYRADRRNWGVDDYWETPGEFFSRLGDCEDYAITKYLSLRRLGWPDEHLRIVTVVDRRADAGHVVLVAAHAGQTWLLDNQSPLIVDTREVDRYRPLFSLNATSWWRHRPQLP